MPNKEKVLSLIEQIRDRPNLSTHALSLIDQIEERVNPSATEFADVALPTPEISAPTPEEVTKLETFEAEHEAVRQKGIQEAAARQEREPGAEEFTFDYSGEATLGAYGVPFDPLEPVSEEIEGIRTKVRAEALRKSGATEDQTFAQIHEAGGLEDPWIDPAMAFTAGAGVAKFSRKLPLVASLFRGGAAALTDYPIGMVADLVSEDNPALGLPIALTLGVVFGVKEEKLVRSLEKTFAKKGVNIATKTAMEMVEQAKVVAKQKTIQDLVKDVVETKPTGLEKVDIGELVKEAKRLDTKEAVAALEATTGVGSIATAKSAKESAEAFPDAMARFARLTREEITAENFKNLSIEGKIANRIPFDRQLDLMVDGRALRGVYDSPEAAAKEFDLDYRGIQPHLSRGDMYLFNVATGSSIAVKNLEEIPGRLSFRDKFVEHTKKLLKDEGGWIGHKSTPKPDFTGEGAKKVDELHEASNKALAEIRGRRTAPELLAALRRGVVDTSGNLKAKAEKMGKAGERVSMYHSLIAGGHNKAIYEMNEIHIPKIYGGLDDVQKDYLNRYISSRRTLTLAGYKGELKQPKGLVKEHLDWIKELPEDLKVKLDERANYYFDVFKNILKEKFDAGLITKEDYDNLVKVGPYSPRQFIHHIDPEITRFVGGKKINVRDSGIKAIKEGSEELLNIDSKLLLSEALTRHQAIMFKNQANRAAAQLAREAPDNGIFSIAKAVKKAKSGKLIYQKPKIGYDSISFMEDGVRKELHMPDAMVKEWLQNDPLLSEATARWIRRLSGSSLIKPMATGLNPEFALTNFPRDMALVWASDHRNIYSANLAKFLGEMSVDLKQIAGDAVKRKGAFVDYINEGGGMEFLTHQGHITTKVGGALDKIQKYLGYMGETSEIMVRLALRNRALKAGYSSKKATAIARTYLDFFQGGSAIKAADTAMPYLNASVQGTRAIGKALIKNPKLFSVKMAQVGVLSTGIYYANRFNNPEAYEQISPHEKANNWIITTPFSFRDKDGNKRYYYFKVAKDQGQRVFSTISESLAAYAVGDKVDFTQVSNSIKEFFSIVPSRAIPPTMKAALGYMSNYDFWRGEPIWKGGFQEIKPEREFTRYTHPGFVKLGDYTKLSPERLKYAMSQFFTGGNIYTSMVGNSWNLIARELPEKERGMVEEELFLKKLFVRKVAKSTNPYYKYGEGLKEARLEANTDKFATNQEFDNIVTSYLRGEKSREEVREFVRKEPVWDRKRLQRRFIRLKKLDKIPNKGFWINIAEMPPEAGAAIYFSRLQALEGTERDTFEKLSRKVPRLYTKRFIRELNILKRGLTKPAE